MKKLFMTGLILSVSSMSFASPDKSEEVKAETTTQESESTSQTSMKQMNLDQATIHEGFRVSVGQSNQTYEVEAKVKGDRRRAEEDGAATILTVGYQKIKLGSMGYSGILSRLSTKLDQIDFTQIGIEGNLTYGINKGLYTYGGLNISNVSAEGAGSSTENFYDDFGTGAGIQLALGYKFHKNIAGELKYASTSYQQDVNSVDVELNSRGMQFTLLGTF